MQPISSTSWAKIVIAKVLNSLACTRYNEIIKIKIQFVLEVSSYSLREIKRIAKAIILFRGLLSGLAPIAAVDRHIHSQVIP